MRNKIALTLIGTLTLILVGCSNKVNTETVNTTDTVAIEEVSTEEVTEEELEQQRIEEERKAEEERLEAERKAEEEKLAEEKRIEEERISNLRAEVESIITDTVPTLIEEMTENHNENGINVLNEIVDTYTKFTKSIECTGTDLNGVAFKGTAYRALWADLAEYYHSDKIYPAGTLICIGDGLAEITLATIECNGIISTKPGYELGEKNDEYDLPVALVGKVPVLFAKDCMPKFGDRIYLSKTEPGKASTTPYGNCLGKIIDKRDDLHKFNTLMCSVRINF